MAITHFAVEKYLPYEGADYTSHRRGGALKTEHAGAVLAVENWRGPEPHWDSGRSADTGEQATIFNGRTWRVVYTDGLCNDMVRDVCYTCEVDADDATREAAQRWSQWATWFARIAQTDREQAAARKAYDLPKEGKRVLIVKGRKVAKGTYWYVHRSGNGDYGPYVHLSSEPRGMGDYVRYVNPENVTVAEPFTYARDDYDGCPIQVKDEIILRLAYRWNTLPRGAYGKWDEVFRDECEILAVLADRLEELDAPAEQIATVRNASNAARPDNQERHW